MSIRDSVSANERALLLDALPRIQQDLDAVNPYLHDLKSIHESFGNTAMDRCTFVLTETGTPSASGPRRYGATFSEISVFSHDNPQLNKRDFVLQRRPTPNDPFRGIQVISDTHQSADPLAYTLLFPHGTHGWHRDLKLKRPVENTNGTYQWESTRSKHPRLTCSKFIKYRMQF